MAGEREVDRDPVDPRVKGTFSVKLVQLLECPNERILQDILGILGRANEADDGRVQTILVSPDQNPERLGLACSACVPRA